MVRRLEGYNVQVISVPSRRSHQALPAEGWPGPSDDDDDENDDDEEEEEEEEEDNDE